MYKYVLALLPVIIEKEVHLHNGLLHMLKLSTFRMWQKTLILLVFNTIFSIQNNKNCKSSIKNGFDKVKLPSFTSPVIANESMKNDVIAPLVKVVDCTEPDAIYQYDYKVPNLF